MSVFDMIVLFLSKYDLKMDMSFFNNKYQLSLIFLFYMVFVAFCMAFFNVESCIFDLVVGSGARPGNG